MFMPFAIIARLLPKTTTLYIIRAAQDLVWFHQPTIMGSVVESTERTKAASFIWKTLISCDTVYHFGFGAPRVVGNYSTIFIYGKVYGVLGVWRSEDAGFTWTQISDPHPNGSLDSAVCINGDMNHFGRVYIGFGGSGFAYGKLLHEYL